MSTSGEFEIVADGEKKAKTASPVVLAATSPPTLNIANGDMLELEENLKEMIGETEKIDTEGLYAYVHLQNKTMKTNQLQS